MCMRQQNIWYDICFDNRKSLPGDDADVAAADDDVGNVSTCDISGADDEGSEICKQQITL